jgi:hypothetical protein
LSKSVFIFFRKTIAFSRSTILGTNVIISIPIPFFRAVTPASPKKEALGVPFVGDIWQTHCVCIILSKDVVNIYSGKEMGYEAGGHPS